MTGLESHVFGQHLILQVATANAHSRIQNSEVIIQS